MFPMTMCLIRKYCSVTAPTYHPGAAANAFSLRSMVGDMRAWGILITKLLLVLGATKNTKK